MDDGKPGLAAQREVDLASSPLFRELSVEGVAAVRAAARRFTMKAGETLFHQGSPAERLVIPLTGSVKLLQASDEGQAVVLRIVEPGEPLALVSVLQGSLYPATAQVLEAGAAVRISGAAMRELIDHEPRIARNALPLLLGRLHELQERYRELATERVERRIARVLIRLVRQSGKRVEGGVRIGMPLTRQELAEMSGTTLYTVSRVLSGWEHEGIVESGRKQLLIRKPHGLVSIAEDLPAGD